YHRLTDRQTERWRNNMAIRPVLNGTAQIHSHVHPTDTVMVAGTWDGVLSPSTASGRRKVSFAEKKPR
ncbi:hypothetical protein AVEN_74672-1, partial [Araneus ventricosus]